jgi:tRNA-2-methylthio-N6-dimethylallyladenosine synthase
MNVSESAAAENTLIELGWKAAEKPETADLIIINTCSVRITAETRIHGRLGIYTALKKKHQFTLILMGCMAENAKLSQRDKSEQLEIVKQSRLAQQKTELQKRFPIIDFVIGTFEKHKIGEIAQQLSGSNYQGAISKGSKARSYHKWNDVASSANF